MAPKLTYFNIRGRGEVIRLTLHAGGMDFIDQRVEFADWPNLRPNVLNGTLPNFEVNGTVYGEALPILRYVAKKCNLMGKTEPESLYVDMVLIQIDTFRNELSRPKMDTLLSKGQQKHLEDKLKGEKIPQFLAKCEQRLTISKTGHVLGGAMTVADIAVWDTVDCLVIDSPEVIQGYPKITEHRQKIVEISGIKKYLASRPVTKI